MLFEEVLILLVSVRHTFYLLWTKVPNILEGQGGVICEGLMDFFLISKPERYIKKKRRTQSIQEVN